MHHIAVNVPFELLSAIHIHFILSNNEVILHSPQIVNWIVCSKVLYHTQHDPYLSDAWSCGVVLFALCLGHFPFAGPLSRIDSRGKRVGVLPNIQDVDTKRNLDKYLAVSESGGDRSYILTRGKTELDVKPVVHPLPAALRDLLLRLLQPDPKKRIPIFDEKKRDVLAHPYVTGDFFVDEKRQALREALPRKSIQITSGDNSPASPGTPFSQDTQIIDPVSSSPPENSPQSVLGLDGILNLKRHFSPVDLPPAQKAHGGARKKGPGTSFQLQRTDSVLRGKPVPRTTPRNAKHKNSTVVKVIGKQPGQPRRKTTKRAAKTMTKNPKTELIQAF